MLRFIRHPALWFSALIVWLGVLWSLSSIAGSPQPLLIPHLDKLGHFGYFLAGGVLFAGWRFRLRPDRPPWGKILAISILAMAVIGGLDEWHQCYTPGRSGGDVWDWLADVTGGTVGAFALRIVHHRLP